jgi:hypothetical protein
MRDIRDPLLTSDGDDERRTKRPAGGALRNGICTKWRPMRGINQSGSVDGPSGLGISLDEPGDEQLERQRREIALATHETDELDEPTNRIIAHDAKGRPKVHWKIAEGWICRLMRGEPRAEEAWVQT